MSKAGFLSKAYAAARQAGLNPQQATLAAAQAAHETGYGVHAPKNNMFGIKAGQNYKGKTQSLLTKEEVGGKLVSVRANFRAYDSMAAAFKDYAKVIEKHWPAALTAASFADAVSALGAGLPGGYATDTGYGAKVTAVKDQMDRLGVQKAFERPDNFTASGPKGLFSVDTGVASHVGHVSRSPLGPVSAALGGLKSPSRPDNASFAGPKGAFSVGANSLGPAAPSTPSKSPDRPDNHNYGGPVGMGGPGGTYVDKASAQAATAATHAAASAARQATAPSSTVSAAPSAVSPSRPDTLGGLNYGSPKGVFSVDPGAAVSGISVAPSPAAPSLGPVAPSIGMQTVTPARPAVAPVPAAAVPKPAVQVAPVAPAVPSYSRQAVAPARPALSPADVYGGTVGTAQTSTPGTTVSRAASYGPTYTTNKFGAVTATAPDGTQMAAWGGVPAAQPSRPAITGPLDNTGIASPATSTVGGMFGPKAKSATGTVAGAAIGGYALGPLGAVLGGMIGRNVAQGKAPFSGIFGGANNANTHVVDTFDGPMRAANAVGGLGFPSAPSGGLMSATGSNNSAAGMRGISPGAAASIGKGQGGLY
jgi:hypothetical protein